VNNMLPRPTASKAKVPGSGIASLLGVGTGMAMDIIPESTTADQIFVGVFGLQYVNPMLCSPWPILFGSSKFHCAMFPTDKE